MVCLKSTQCNNQISIFLWLLNISKTSAVIRVYRIQQLCWTKWSSVIFVVCLQPKQLRKLIQQTFQQYSTLKEEECMVKFFRTFGEFINFNEEVFPCELVVSSKQPTTLLTDQFIQVSFYTFDNYLCLNNIKISYCCCFFCHSKAGV